MNDDMKRTFQVASRRAGEKVARNFPCVGIHKSSCTREDIGNLVKEESKLLHYTPSRSGPTRAPVLPKGQIEKRNLFSNMVPEWKSRRRNEVNHICPYPKDRRLVLDD